MSRQQQNALAIKKWGTVIRQSVARDINIAFTTRFETDTRTYSELMKIPTAYNDPRIWTQETKMFVLITSGCLF